MKNRIKDLREDMDLRQSDLSKAIGIDQRTISNYETGKTTPDGEALIKIANFFNVSIDYILYRSSCNATTNAKRIKLIEQIQRDLEKLK